MEETRSTAAARHEALGLPTSIASGAGSELVKAMKDTSRRMIYHLTLAILLSIRLCKLPLLFLCHKFGILDMSILSVACELFRRIAYRTVEIIPENIKQHPLVFEWAHRFRKMCAGLARMLRVIYALYTLGELLDQNPNLLRTRRNSFARQPSTTHRIGSVSPVTDGIVHQATASQVYHAALANDHSTLDDLLAGFSESAERPQSDQGNQRVSRRVGTGCQCCGHGTRCRNSSIQTTPERMFTPLKACNERPEFPLELDSHPPSSGEQTVSQLPTTGQDIPPAVQPPASTTTTDLIDSVQQIFAQADEGKASIHSQASSQGSEGCPRETARQAQSQIPRRRSSPPETTSESSTRARRVSKRQSLLIVDPATPTRRVRLQRRVRSPRT